MKKIATLLVSLVMLAGVQPCLCQTYEVPQIKHSRDKVRVDGRVYWSHVVTEKHTLWSIARTYGVTVEEIYAANPTLNLKTEGLKTGQILMIPVSDKDSGRKPRRGKEPPVKAEEMPESSPSDKTDSLSVMPGSLSVAPDSLTVAKDSLECESDSLDVIERPSYVSLSVVLPLGNAGNDGFTEFYSGVLLAARDLGSRGHRIELKLNSPGEVCKDRHSLDDADIILGPVSCSDIKACLANVPHGGKLVSPLDPKAALLTDSLAVIQAPTPWEDQLKDLVKWASEEMQPSDSLLVVSESGAALSEMSRFLVNELKKSGLAAKNISYGILEGLSISETFASLASKEGTTRIFIASDNEAFVGDVIRNANLLAYKNFDVTVYCNSKVRSFELINVETFHNVSLRMTSAYFTDYSRADVKAFVMAYRALFNAEPSSYAFQGYDTAMYFASLYLEYGRRWFRKMPQFIWRGLQTDFRFEPGKGKGQVNKAVRRIIYNKDYSITLL